MIEQLTRTEKSILMKKLMAICPACKKMIYGRDIDFSQLKRDQIRSFPVDYRHSHSHEADNPHILTLRIDANFAVRDSEIHYLKKY